jgi:hypothetical protein
MHSAIDIDSIVKNLYAGQGKPFAAGSGWGSQPGHRFHDLMEQPGLLLVDDARGLGVELRKVVV